MKETEMAVSQWVKWDRGYGLLYDVCWAAHIHESVHHCKAQ
jgi:hypothetical protein